MKTRLFSFVFLLGLFIQPCAVPVGVDNVVDGSQINSLVAAFQKLKPDATVDELRDFIATALHEVEKTGSLRISSRSNRSNASVLCFVVGAVAGVTIVITCFGAFYLCACSKELPRKKENQSDIPDNFPQKNNWCWMVATLHSLYPLQLFREWIDKKASDDLTAMDGEDKARVELAQQLKDLFEKMERYAQTKFPADEKARTQATKKFYDRLFEIKEEHNIKMCPKRKCEGYGCNSFWDGLNYFFFQNKLDCLTGIVLEDDYVSPTPFLSLEPSIQKYVEWLASNTEDNRVVASKKIIPFELNCDETVPTIINEKISLLDKNYSPKSIVIRRPGSKGGLGHCTASVIYDEGAWYFFDSFARERKELSPADVQNLLDGQGYAGFKPKLVFYSQI